MFENIIKYLFGREWFCDEYVATMISRDDSMWKYDEKYLYYSYKNSNYILPSILFFLFCMLGGWEGILQYCFVWLPFMYFVCHSNNRALDRDTRTVIKRIEFMNYRIKKGE